jgi:VIT1/CCC1 family predicted Fe2+/Mn2+ transporter
MRKVIASEFVSLDGVMEDPSWTFQFGSEDQEKFKFDELANHMRALPRGGWRAHGIFEMLGAVLLVLPAAANWMPVLTPLAAAALALETLALAVLYARYSLELAATNPMVWAVVMGLLAAFVAYGRYALMPPA